MSKKEPGIVAEPDLLWCVAWSVTYTSWVGGGKVSKDHLAFQVTENEKFDHIWGTFKTLCGRTQDIKLSRDPFYLGAWSHKMSYNEFKNFGLEEERDCKKCAAKKATLSGMLFKEDIEDEEV
jgi:hypothetical protein